MCARPVKPRRCRCPFRGGAFKPSGIPMGELEHIPMTREEVEAIRLCDLVGRTQEDAGRLMGVSRGTVQRIVSAARRKIARAIVERAALVFEDAIRKKE